MKPEQILYFSSFSTDVHLEQIIGMLYIPLFVHIIVSSYSTQTYLKQIQFVLSTFKGTPITLYKLWLEFFISVSSLLFSGLSLVGSVLFAMAVMTGIRGTRFMFILMMIGRMLIGAGTGSSVSKYMIDFRLLLACELRYVSCADPEGVAEGTRGLPPVKNTKI